MEIVFLLVAFAIAQLVAAAGKKKQRERRRAEPGGEERPRDLLAEIREALEERQRQGRTQAPIGQRTPGGLPPGRRQPTTIVYDEDGYEDEDEAESLERTPTVISLETPVVYQERELVDHDDEIEAVVARRIKYAEAQARALTPADHRKFDKRIREPVVPRKPSAKALHRARLRELFIAKEILGRPVALREPGDR